ncbi:hypothetical protein GCM10010844_44130 [Deinococcus radiotolerans]|uniref:Uncharacterized protein n=1 Tax=Deinococcus radiotolerans TaxID=1309407 RepID=A0ABQ2FRP1_9DEIO|nr:hypothetical protein GCM10010844_44130 [Deinococcus radiotolerans]
MPGSSACSRSNGTGTTSPPDNPLPPAAAPVPRPGAVSIPPRSEVPLPLQTTIESAETVVLGLAFLSSGLDHWADRIAPCCAQAPAATDIPLSW